MSTSQTPPGRGVIPIEAVQGFLLDGRSPLSRITPAARLTLDSCPIHIRPDRIPGATIGLAREAEPRYV